MTTRLAETLEQKITRMLIEHGLWESEAHEVIAELKAIDTGMGDRWNDQAEGYPPQLIDTLWMWAKTQALAWIDKNNPAHFARFMLAHD